MKNEQRIRFGANPPSALYEKLPLSTNCPYIIRFKRFPAEDIAPLHYSDELEILVCYNVVGKAIINNVQHHINGDAIFVIPPQVIHSIHIQKCEGYNYVVHISLSEMKKFLDIEFMLNYVGTTVHELLSSEYKFDEINDCINELITNDEDFFDRMQSMIKLLKILNRANVETDQKNVIEHHDSAVLSQLQSVIAWTAKNYHHPVTVEEAARQAGFSKSHFCVWFKKHTHQTYNNYLADVRISSACKILIRTQSVATACFDSGFSNVSYFSQLFKRKMNVSPTEYLANHQKYYP